jgi:hypothetical protein
MVPTTLISDDANPNTVIPTEAKEQRAPRRSASFLDMPPPPARTQPLPASATSLSTPMMRHLFQLLAKACCDDEDSDFAQQQHQPVGPLHLRPIVSPDVAFSRSVSSQDLSCVPFLHLGDVPTSTEVADEEDAQWSLQSLELSPSQCAAIVDNVLDDDLLFSTFPESSNKKARLEY